jgi:hypothetical protein
MNEAITPYLETLSDTQKALLDVLYDYQDLDVNQFLTAHHLSMRDARRELNDAKTKIHRSVCLTVAEHAEKNRQPLGQAVAEMLEPLGQRIDPLNIVSAVANLAETHPERYTYIDQQIRSADSFHTYVVQEATRATQMLRPESFEALVGDQVADLGPDRRDVPEYVQVRGQVRL